ncbi:MAG: PD-(D/E)XK nuclease family protein [Planctomycetes bacterium]|nr:PD-(D/E)XK nuclease family protein [Planctomycetota bacterium]
MSTTHDSDTTDKMHQLDAFLVDNRELEGLNARLGSFNIFRVLRVERTEIRHSNVLAWLLTPDETHGLGATFLRRFLSRLLLESDVSGISLTPAQVELMNLSDVEVRREWKNIDILVHSQEHNWCLLIENKIDSKESRDQLERYVKTVHNDMPGCQIIPVYLTVEGDDPSEAGKKLGFVALSHSQVLEVAEQITEQHKTRIPRDASVFLQHYLDSLRRMTMQDDQLIDLCKTIYRRHREAIDLIVEYGASSRIVEACEEEAANLIDCEFIKTTGSRIWFLPREMGEHEPTLTLTAWQFLPRHVAVACWFYHLKKSGKLQVVMEVGPVSDGALRKRLLRSIQAAGFSFSEKSAFKDDAMYTRITSEIQKLRTDADGEPEEDPDYIKQVVRKLWATMWKEGAKIVDVLKRFDWKGKE